MNSKYFMSRFVYKDLFIITNCYRDVSKKQKHRTFFQNIVFTDLDILL